MAVGKRRCKFLGSDLCGMRGYRRTSRDSVSGSKSASRAVQIQAQGGTCGDQTFQWGPIATFPADWGRGGSDAVAVIRQAENLTHGTMSCASGEPGSHLPILQGRVWPSARRLPSQVWFRR